MYDRETVQAAMNRAADEIIEALDLPDEGERDIVNLTVNTAMHYLDAPAATLTEAITTQYAEDPDDVLRWCGKETADA